jgi:hypothetical protein
LATFTDASCTQQSNVVEANLFGDYGPCSAKTGNVAWLTTDHVGSCESAYVGVVKLGAAPASPPVLYSGTSCVTITPMEPHTVSGTMPPSAFAAFGTAQIGSGRLRVPSYVDGAGKVLAAVDGLFDSGLGVTCDAATFVDGVRCVPRDAAQLDMTNTFADGSCTAPLAVMGATTLPGCTVPPPPAFGVRSSCGRTTAYAIGQAATPSTIYSLQGSTCTAQQPVTSYAYYTTSPAGDTQWAPVTERTE